MTLGSIHLEVKVTALLVWIECLCHAIVSRHLGEQLMKKLTDESQGLIFDAYLMADPFPSQNV